jgi:hypothetical protein
VFHPAADLGREGTSDDRRQSQRHARGGRNDSDGLRSGGFQAGYPLTERLFDIYLSSRWIANPTPFSRSPL